MNDRTLLVLGCALLGGLIATLVAPASLWAEIGVVHSGATPGTPARADGVPRSTASASPAATPAAARPGIGPVVDVRFDGDRVIVGGVIADDAIRNRLIRRAVAIHGAGNVDDQLRIEPGARANWLETDALYGPVQTLGSPRILFDGQVLSLQGRVASADARQRAENDARSQMPAGTRIDNRLQVQSQQPTNGREG